MAGPSATAHRQLPLRLRRQIRPYQSDSRSALAIFPPPIDALTASPVGVSVAVGALSVQHSLSTAATGVGLPAAALSVQHLLASGPTGVGRLGGALSVTHKLSTAPIGVGALGGTLAETHRLAAAPTGVGSSAGALSVRHLLVGASVGVGAARAGLSLRLTLAAVPVGAGRLTASLGVLTPPIALLIRVSVTRTAGSLAVRNLGTGIVTAYVISPAAANGGTVLVDPNDLAHFLRAVDGSQVVDPIEAEFWRLAKPFVPQVAGPFRGE